MKMKYLTNYFVRTYAAILYKILLFQKILKTFTREILRELRKYSNLKNIIIELMKEL